MTDPNTATSKTTKPVRVLDGRFELVAPLGNGGMAEVWRARDRRLDREVAVKLLPASASRDASRRRRIEREARALAALNDPNIVAVYDYGEEPDDKGVVPYLVMELVDGPDLHRYLHDAGPLDVGSALRILRPVGRAVATAHEAGIVHGDLKPANVFVDAHGPKVGDFGVARVTGEETGATTLAATPAFAAPEVLRGGRPTKASDVYSLACLAFELLAGRPPYEGSNTWEVASKHLEAPIPSVRLYRSSVPVALDEAIRRGMQKDPKRRPESVTSFVESLGPPPATVPVTAAPEAPETKEATEVLPSHPDLAGIAVFGPFAGWAERIRRRYGSRRHPSRRGRGVLIACAVGLAVPMLLLAMGTRQHTVRIPDVKGQAQAVAVQNLEQAGFSVTGVSYEIISSGDPGFVIRTIPPAGADVKRGSAVHVIAGATAAPTPEPLSEDVATPREPRKPRAHPKHD
jgi:serine/threonine-protein kinase